MKGLPVVLMFEKKQLLRLIRIYATKQKGWLTRKKKGLLNEDPLSGGRGSLTYNIKKNH